MAKTRRKRYTFLMPFNSRAASSAASGAVLRAAADDDGRRLDRILRKALPDMPLSAIHRLLRKGRVLVDGEKAPAGRLIRTGELIAVDAAIPAAASPAAEPVEGGGKHRPGGAASGGAKNGGPEIRRVRGAHERAPRRPAETDALAIIFEGAGLLAIDKPAGLAVHGKESLEDLVLSYLAPKLPPSLSFRPGPLHRLDKPSSGLIVFSASLEGARLFSALMRDRKIRKFYLALVEGIVEKPEIWRDELWRDRDLQKTFSVKNRAPNGGKAGGRDGGAAQTALTKVRPLAANAGCSLIEAEIETGRTHQIRAQAAAHGRPLLGDRKYGGGSFPGSPAAPGESFLLHAWRMELPEGLPFPRSLEAPPPEFFRRKMRELFGEEAAANAP